MPFNKNISSSAETPRLLGWLSIKAFLIFLIILYAGIGLGPDEAQYWTWSQALDWGYYSKPPAIAWQIWSGTQLFGETEFGIRFLSVLLAFCQAYAVYLLALQAGLSSKGAFWSGLCMAFSPLGLLGSLFATTDGGFVLCWTGACLTVVTALKKQKAPSPLLVGSWLLIGALFKWPIYLFWVFYLCARYWYFPTQRLRQVIRGVLLSFAGLLPSVWWNIKHDWATFRHVFAAVQGGTGAKGSHLMEFIGSQFAIVSPLLFLCLLGACIQVWRQRHQLSSALYFCGFVTGASLTLFTFLACFQKIQGNWTAFAYPTAWILLSWVFVEQKTKYIKWMQLGIGVSVLLIGLLFLNSFLVVSSPSFSSLFSYRLNPLKHNLGWSALQQALQKEGYDSQKHFLVSDRYQTTSLLSFYNKGQKRAYFLNLKSIRNNQFCYWPCLQQEQQGKTGYFVWTENVPYLEREWKIKLDFYKSALKEHFAKVEFLGVSPLLYEGPTKIVKAAFIFRCQDCQDIEIKKSKLY